MPELERAPAVEPRVTILTRPGCHLCDVAKDVMRRLESSDGVAWREVDVTTDAALEREYGDRLPVVLLDGVEHGYWRVEEARLLRDLGAEP